MACNQVPEVGSALLKAIQKTFMDMAFVDIIPADGGRDVNYSSVLYINFFQPVAGGMILRLSKEFKMTIVENVHGSDWESLTSDEIDDCLLEILNVLAGNFLNEYCGKSIGHNMSFPQLLFDEQEVVALEEYASYYFDAEGIIFQVDVCVEGK